MVADGVVDGAEHRAVHRAGHGKGTVHGAFNKILVCGNRLCSPNLKPHRHAPAQSLAQPHAQ